jgi:hypothetical protein
MNPSAASAGLFSELLLHDAPAMMRRMVAGLQSEVVPLSNASYCTLLLKLSENDLVREFAAGINGAMAAGGGDEGFAKTEAAGLSFSLEPLEPTELASKDDLATSAALLAQLKAAADGHSVVGAGLLTKDFFPDLLKSIFEKARIEGSESATLMPLARRALNAELVALYKRVVTGP